MLSCPEGVLPWKLIKQSRMGCNEWVASKDVYEDEWGKDSALMSFTDIGPGQFGE